jgi:hypothetical protein
MEPNMANPVQLPLPPTLFRLSLINERASGLVERLAGPFRQLLMMRDGSALRRIEQAGTADEAVNLVTVASGLAQPAWHRKVRSFGEAALAPLAESLAASCEVPNPKRRAAIQESLLAELRWFGEPGAQIIRSVMASLGDRQQSLACVALGLVGSTDAADGIWATAASPVFDSEELLVGAAWALTDLEDARAGQVVAKALRQGYSAFEWYAMAERIGDEAVFLQLIERVMTTEARQKEATSFALVGIAHRLGELRLRETLIEAGCSLSEADEIVSDLLGRSPSISRDYFGALFAGISNEAADSFLDQVVPE